MNYSESKLILEKIEKANKIILNCHYSPDADSVGSSLSLYQVIKDMGKDVTVFSPGKISDNLKFLPFFEDIKIVNFSEINYSDYDLFIATDSSTWDNIVGNKDFLQPEIEMIVIDHHKSNGRYGSLNLVDDKSVAVCEVLFKVFEDMKIKMNSKIATTLLTGIIGDSGAFRFPATTSETFVIAAKLMSYGANKDEIILNMFQSTDYGTLKFWGLALTKLKIENRFAWTAIDYKEYSKSGRPLKAKSSFATVFLQSIDNVDFGFIAVEEQPGLLDISLRSRTGKVDTSKIGVELGGGGHLWASGGKIQGLSFENAVEKALKIARKYSE